MRLPGLLEGKLVSDRGAKDALVHELTQPCECVVPDLGEQPKTDLVNSFFCLVLDESPSNFEHFSRHFKKMDKK